MMSLDNLKTILNAIKCLLTDYDDDDILECLIGTDMLSAVKDADGKILTDETGKIILM